MVNILSGACFAIGLKYAGTANKQAHRVLMQFVRDFLSMLGSTPSVEMAGKPCLYRCLCSLLVCAAMVMSGTGDLEVFRVVRQLRERVASGDMNYGNFMAIHMALGLLFLGGCTRALCNSSRAVAVLVAAFYPIYPASSICNRYHLQALRHLYVLATSSRILLARNVETGTISSVPIKITTKNELGKTDTHQLTLPSVMTNWDTIESIEVVGERCWTFTLQVTPELRKKLVYSGTIYVKDRIGYFSYEDDPEGQQSSLSIALLNGYQDHSSFFSVGHGFVDIHELSKNPFVKTFASCVCPPASGGVSEEASLQRFYNSALTECVLKEKLDLLPSYVALEKLSLRIHSSTPADLKQFGLMRAYSTTCANRGSEAVISCQFLLTQETRLKFLLEEAEARLDPSTNLDSLLKWYMLNSSPPPQSTAEAVLLGCFLSMYSIPPPHHLPITAQTSCLDVYEALKDVHLPPAAVLRLLSLFTADLYQFLSQLDA